MSDKRLRCIDCDCEFIFSVAEQQYYTEKELKNTPKRCANCRVLEKAKRTTNIFDSLTQATCATCGATAIVPFKAKGHKPIYCAQCFVVQKQSVKQIDF
jgi:CxxC-x17-CxxC domain-containing protein